MKALSLWQPWASLIVLGEKRIETRHWETKYRGPLLIHAAKRWDRWTHDTVMDEPFFSSLDRPEIGHPIDHECRRLGLQVGSIIGVANLRDCIPTEHIGAPALTQKEYAFGDFSEGRFGWILTNVRQFPKPIPFCGRQGIFDVPDYLLADALREAVLR